MNDEQLLRYSRQIMLPDVDIAGQEKLMDATALIIGLGGLGSPVSLYLAAAGVGHLILVDNDAVDLSNLQRQIAHGQSNIGENKALSAKQRIAEINPDIVVEAHDYRLNESIISKLIDQATIVLDCTDNADTRYLLNDHCWRKRTPLVSGAAIRWEGQITIFDANIENSPCYRCLYPNQDSANMNCSENGVIAPLVGIIGTCQALEAIKYICGVGESLCGRILYLDAKYMEWRSMSLAPNKSCDTCGKPSTTLQK